MLEPVSVKLSKRPVFTDIIIIDSSTVSGEWTPETMRGQMWTAYVLGHTLIITPATWLTEASEATGGKEPFC